MMNSLYIGATGLHSHSLGLQVVADNLANISTVGFKQSMALYQDLFNSPQSTRANGITEISQLGLGAAFVDARTVFTPGGFESSNTVTDMAINGNGFFGVLRDGEMLYTKAGNMRFDADGRLLDPTGYNLVGRKMTDGAFAATYSPIQIDMSPGSAYATVPARPTTALVFNTNLGGTEDAGASAGNPFFALSSSWSGTLTPPLGEGGYTYSEGLTIYDAAGNPRTATIYYDFAGALNGMKVYEYVLGIDPALDASERAGSKAAGLLMSGTLTFNSSGGLVGASHFLPGGADPADLNSWTPAPLAEGLPLLNANFADAGPQSLSLDFGLQLPAGMQPGLNSPSAGATNPELFSSATQDAARTSNACTSYGSNNVSRYQHQDGYPAGELNDLRISEDGYITGRYSNGQTQDLYRISLFRFKSQDGLRHEGGNHFAATYESGAADEGLPRTENFGAILSSSLETSNVDMAREFATMIITQRGFQANSKIITTADTMLQRALDLKR
jgi:flagellar hook protein FlgE